MIINSAETSRALKLAVWWRLAGLVWLAIGLLLALSQLPDMPFEVDHLDKLQHALGFALMMFYAGSVFPETRFRAACGMLLYGIAIELLQMLVPWRSAEWLDVAADLLGIAAGWLLLLTPLNRLLAWVDGRLCLLLPGRR